jgi:hypothetical protein
VTSVNSAEEVDCSGEGERPLYAPVAKTDMDMSLSKASEGDFIGNRFGSKDVTVSEF